MLGKIFAYSSEYSSNEALVHERRMCRDFQAANFRGLRALPVGSTKYFPDNDISPCERGGLARGW
jgi:hypothetical protein